MSAIRVTAARTVGRARNLVSTAFVFWGFLAVVALFFAFGLESAEGGELPVSVIWASAVSYVLPALAALLSMDVWSEERQTGRIDTLLSLAVRERDFVLGKFLGTLALVLSAVFLSLALSVALLFVSAPQALEGIGPSAFVMAFSAIAVQSVLWCAVNAVLSVMFKRPAAVACASLVLTLALPRGIWAGMMSWASAGRLAFGEFPLDAHVVDIASGTVPGGTVAAYFVSAIFALFVAAKFVAACRLSGGGGRVLRVSTGVTVLLAVAVLALALPLLQKANPTFEVPVAGAKATLSPRSRGILTETSGDISITCFLSRGDVRFRPVARILRQLERESAALGGARILLRFVDPRWDVGAADRLVRRGVDKESLVFEKGRRMSVVALGESCGERLCASAIRSISTLTQRRNVYWTVGHGEGAFDGYDAFGMSDIARDLAREGFRNEPIDLSAAQQIPGDCALILIAGAKDDFSRVEIGRLDAYLREGGRLLALQGSTSGGVGSMLPAWGVRPLDALIEGAKTLSGTDVIASEFSDHPISAPLKGSRIVLERPVSFEPSAAVGTGAGADSIEFHAVAKTRAAVVAATIERGAGAGRDLAIRPTRIVVLGDPTFVQNAALASRASANRDFFLNCVAYLSGAETHGFGDDGSNRLQTGFDRSSRLRHVVWTAGALPFAVFLILAAVAIRRRRRT